MRQMLLAALSAVSLGGAAAAQGTGAETMTLREDSLGWEAVGRVEVANGGGFCTGALIETDLVLTAAHCLFGPEGGPVEPGQLRFRAGLVRDQVVAERGVTAVAVHPSYQRGAEITVDTIRYDLALLRLDAPIPAATAAPFTVGTLPDAGREVAVVSFASNRAEALGIERECHVTGRSGGLFAFDCDVSFGSSGAPVFDMSGGRGRIVSIISGGDPEGPAPVAYGMDVAQGLGALRRTLRDAENSVTAAGSTLNTLTQGGETRAGGAKFVSAKNP